MEMTVDQMMQQAKLALNESKLEEAEFLFQNILQAQPTHYKAHNNLGVVLRNLGKFKEAIVHFRQALKIKPDYKAVNESIGRVLLDMGNYKDGLEMMSKGVGFIRFCKEKIDIINTLNNEKN